jgi:hypothetical protein
MHRLQNIEKRVVFFVGRKLHGLGVVDIEKFPV